MNKKSTNISGERVIEILKENKGKQGKISTQKDLAKQMIINDPKEKAITCSEDFENEFAESTLKNKNSYLNQRINDSKPFSRQYAYEVAKTLQVNPLYILGTSNRKGTDYYSGMLDELDRNKQMQIDAIASMLSLYGIDLAPSAYEINEQGIISKNNIDAIRSNDMYSLYKLTNNKNYETRYITLLEIEQLIEIFISSLNIVSVPDPEKFIKTAEVVAKNYDKIIQNL